MRFDLAQMARRLTNSARPSADLRLIQPTKVQQDELARIIVKAVRAISEQAGARVMPAYRTALARATQDSIRDDVPALGGAVDDLSEELQRLVLTLTPELRRWVLSVEKWHRGKWTGAAMTATSVDLTTLIGPNDVQDTIEAVLARNVALIRDIGAQAQGRIAQAVWQGFQQRSPAREVASAINEAVQLGRDRSLRVAADQTQKLSAALDRERRQQAGIDTWVWRWSHKLHGRPEHIARDGNVYTDATAPDDLPGDLPFCGCRAQAIVTFE